MLPNEMRIYSCKKWPTCFDPKFIVERFFDTVVVFTIGKRIPTACFIAMMGTTPTIHRCSTIFLTLCSSRQFIDHTTTWIREMFQQKLTFTVARKGFCVVNKIFG